MDLSQTGLKAYCSGCRKTYEVNSIARQRFIEDYDCDDCRFDETKKGETMAKAKRKGEDEPGEKMNIQDAIKKHPQLVKGKSDGEEHPAVTEAKSQEIAVKNKLPGMEDPEFVPDELIEAWAIERKKISKNKVALMARETELGDFIRGRLADLGMRNYVHAGVCKVELESVKEKLVITIDTDEE